QPASSPAPVAPAAIASEVVAVPAAAASHVSPSADDSGSKMPAGQHPSHPQDSANSVPRKLSRPTAPPANIDSEDR
ncbi:MAG TPA: hypothetical protein VEF03_12975, partial [Candidatus Binataceae bacterium]|nr:hypothetical protein [Candidatus Binataceae bacterium]